MINRDSYKSLIETVNAAVTGEDIQEGMMKKPKPVLPPKDPNRNNPLAKKGPIAEEELENDVEWDSIDEILAEGIAAFGEDAFVAILENFEETGELPEEMIELIDSISDEDDE